MTSHSEEPPQRPGPYGPGPYAPGLYAPGPYGPGPAFHGSLRRAAVFLRLGAAAAVSATLLLGGLVAFPELFGGGNGDLGLGTAVMLVVVGAMMLGSAVTMAVDAGPVARGVPRSLRRATVAAAGVIAVAFSLPFGYQASWYFVVVFLLLVGPCAGALVTMRRPGATSADHANGAFLAGLVGAIGILSAVFLMLNYAGSEALFLSLFLSVTVPFCVVLLAVHRPTAAGARWAVVTSTVMLAILVLWEARGLVFMVGAVVGYPEYHMERLGPQVVVALLHAAILVGAVVLLWMRQARLKRSGPPPTPGLPAIPSLTFAGPPSP